MLHPCTAHVPRAPGVAAGGAALPWARGSALRITQGSARSPLADRRSRRRPARRSRAAAPPPRPAAFEVRCAPRRLRRPAPATCWCALACLTEAPPVSARSPLIRSSAPGRFPRPASPGSKPGEPAATTRPPPAACEPPRNGPPSGPRTPPPAAMCWRSDVLHASVMQPDRLDRRATAACPAPDPSIRMEPRHERPPPP